MSPKTNDPNNPNDLSLQPSKAAGSGEQPDFSNVQGHSDTMPAGDRPDFSNVQAHSDTVPMRDVQSYTVQPGDTLSHIAQRHYGKASRWHAIFDANRDQIDDPDKIFPGQVLKLPAE
jgi:nucleoid-associated protein YgaU